MSKIITEQVAKTNILIAGLRKQILKVKDKGINDGFINELETDCKELAVLGKELEQMRDAIYAKTHETNRKLVSIKTRVQSTKKMVKSNFTQDFWADFGIADKR